MGCELISSGAPVLQGTASGPGIEQRPGASGPGGSIRDNARPLLGAVGTLDRPLRRPA